MAKAQRKIANAEARKVRLDEAKADIEARHQRSQEEQPQRRAEQQQPERRTQQGDPVEAFLATRTDATRNWLRAHPDHARSFAMNMVGGASTEDVRRAKKLTAAHEDALAEGIDPDTPAYFSHLESFIGPKAAPEKVNGNGSTQIPNRRRSTVPVAPVQASAGGTSGGGPEVRLTKDEAKAATDGITIVWNYDDPSPQKKFKKGDPIGIQEMARRKHELTKRGAYDRSYTES